jgi:hypothetical protein
VLVPVEVRELAALDGQPDNRVRVAGSQCDQELLANHHQRALEWTDER